MLKKSVWRVFGFPDPSLYNNENQNIKAKEKKHQAHIKLKQKKGGKRI